MLKNVTWAEDRDYKTGSEDEPLQFYLDGLTNSNRFDLLLGYFSSSAISLLSLGFANFLSKGGKMRLVINHILSENDKKAVQQGQNNNIENPTFDITNIERLKETLDGYDKHFFECLAWLISEKRIELKVIKPKTLRGIAHYKAGVFYDNDMNRVGYNGSCNFTMYGLSENLEKMNIFLSWENGRSNKFINKQIKDFDNYYNEIDKDVDYLNVNDIEVAIRDKFGNKTIKELLIQEKDLIERKKIIEKNPSIKKTIEKIIEENELSINEPKFPYPTGPREYQSLAYNKWVQNNYQGIFAMATGTGKTITSLNCILQEYKKNNYYQFIVLVPTISLSNQWQKEIENNFNFQNVISCSSHNPNWENNVNDLASILRFEQKENFAILATYQTFRTDRFQRCLNVSFKNNCKNFTLIADESHTLGSTSLLKKLPNSIAKRIGLSATPERQYDDVGELALSNYFNSFAPDYTYAYDMKKAIENDVLCKYVYKPIIVKLEKDEILEYNRISKKLSKWIDSKTGKYKNDPYVTQLLIKRKNVIHKAKNKIHALKSIVKNIGIENFINAFIYVPEGTVADYSLSDQTNNDPESEKLLKFYTEELFNEFKLKMRQFTGETKDKENIIDLFKQEKINVLLAMKCLDEGVDIPQAQFAIFCSSTGNPRQYIQRRGRVLRNYESDVTGKKKEIAFVYDLLVKPAIDVTNTNISQTKVEKNIFKNEIKRFVNFAVLADNKIECLKEIENLCYDIGIDLYEIINQEELKYY